MSKKIIFLGVILFFLSSCSLFTNSEETKKIPPFTFHKAPQFDDRPIQSVFISSKGDYYVGTLEGLAVYMPQYQEFELIDDKNTRGITKLKEFNGRFYASISGSNSIVSSQDGHNWQRELQLQRPVFDFWVTPDSLIVMGSEFGTYVKTPGLQKLTRARFLESDIIFDFIVTLSQTENGALFAGCHDGIYRSTDQGQNWVKTSTEISKYYDNIQVLLTGRGNRLFAVGGDILYLSEDNGDNWETMYLPDNAGYNLIQNSDGRFYIPAETGFYLSPPDDIEWKFVDLKEYIKELDSISKFHISGEKIIIYDEMKMRVYFGEVNWHSPFWDNRES